MAKEVLENWNTLPDAEKTRLRAHPPIALDDDTAICTAAGWQKWIAHRDAEKARYAAEQKAKK